MGTKRKPQRSLVRPTNREFDVLEVLWTRGPSTAREVLEGLGDAHEAGYTSLQKIMTIMLEKGWVERSAEGRTHRYAARAAREDVQRRMVGEMLDRVFGGSVATLVQSALASRHPSDEELRQVEALLEDATAEGDGTDEEAER